MSIRLRLTLWYSSLLAATLIVFGVLVYYVVSINTMKDLKTRLHDEVAAVQPYGAPGQNGVELRFTTPATIDYNLTGIQIVSYLNSDEGAVTSKTFGYGTNLDYPAKQDAKVRYVTTKLEGKPFLLYETPVRVRGSDKVIGLLQVAAYIGKEENMLAALRTILFLAGAVGLALAFLLGMFLSRKALRPIGQVARAVEQIQSGSDLSVRLPVENQDEIGRLSHTLNHMLARIEGAYKGLEETYVAQRRFVSDASHELRTPLTTIRGNVDFLEKVWEAASLKAFASNPDDTQSSSSSNLSLEEREQLSKEAIHDIADEARRMSRLVNDLLSLARADAGYDMPMERVELKPLAEEAARRAVYLPRTADWKLGSLDVLEGVAVRGNRDYLLQLLFIFIENGFKYTPSGEVRLEALRKDDMVGLAIADTGIGIKKDEVPRIFDRFYRVDVSRGQTQGTGLGLSIAKWIADMHGATLEVRTKLGEGTTFIVWLPVDFSRPGDYGIIEPSVRPQLPERES
ncbi:HAMP domain-containing sensor histidine kinase [Cohnella lubricantis]|uniref:histidine kinase n=1 Tax=Cohnella lubricantis TaxID=2163172 RepID=A0A841T9E8_9BACL|nr:HAMP domain-containing sensor histidine kinase [Cohnella lubricantis]MBB6678133.1 HAMP domain-containing histidine kinase [Cohnella lubricantis]MBP2116694.1 signal transduction histidine kinase [Cohnella lubricantis]